MTSWAALTPLDDLEIAVMHLCRNCNREMRHKIAEELGISTTHLTDIIQGHVSPSLEVAEKLKTLAPPSEAPLHG